MKIKAIIILISLFIFSLFITSSCISNKVSEPKPSSVISSSKILKIGNSNYPGYRPWQIAQETGIFAKNNISVDFRLYEYAESLKFMADGQLDGNNQTLSDTITLLGNNSKVDQVIVLCFDISNGADKIIVRKEIKKVADLKGKKVAVEIGSIDHFLLLLGLKKAGINPKNVNIVNLDLSSSVVAFVEGQVDAVATFVPYSNEAFKRPGSHTLFTSKDFPGAIPDLIAVKKQLITERPEVVQALVKSWFDSQKFIQENPEKSYKMMAESSGISVEEYKQQEASIKFFTLEDNLRIFQNGKDRNYLPYAAEEIGKFLLENKIIKQMPNFSNLLDDRFIKALAK